MLTSLILISNFVHGSIILGKSASAMTSQTILFCRIFWSKKTIGISLNRYGINSSAAQFVRSINVKFITRLIYTNHIFFLVSSGLSIPLSQNINPPNYSMLNSPLKWPTQNHRFFDVFKGYKRENWAVVSQMNRNNTILSDIIKEEKGIFK